MNNQKGISLYLSVIVVVLLLSIVLGLSLILANQFKMVRNAEKSSIALSAADAGIERALVDIIHNAPNPPPSSYPIVNLDNGASYEVMVLDSSNPSCDASFYCVKSIGRYGESSRALWVKI